MRSIGKGIAASRMFCSVMDLPQPPSKFERFYKVIGPAVSSVAEESMKAAVNEAIEENDGNRDITAAFDGTWQKRGKYCKFDYL